MKKTLILILAASFVATNVQAETLSLETKYFCKTAYEAKLARIEKNHTLRTIGGASMLVGTLAVGMGALTGVFIINPVAGGMATVAFLGSGGMVEFTSLDREDNLRKAKSILEISQVERSVLISALYEAWVTKTLANINEGRKSDGYAPYNREQIAHELQTAEELGLKSEMDVLLDDVNSRLSKNKAKPLTYEQLQAEMNGLLSTDAFCSLSGGKNHPATYSKIVRTISQ